MISNSNLKKQFESKYQELDVFFKQEWEQIHKTTVNELKLFKDSFKLNIKSNQEAKNEFISQYSNEYKNLQSDVINFLNNAFNNSLDNELWDFNINKFNNKDRKEGFSEYELEQYAQILDKAMNHMNILWSFSDFKKQYTDTNKEPDFLSWKWDIALANKVDSQEYIFWKGEDHLTAKLHNYSEEELHLMREESFDITDSNKMKNFIILLGLELWDWIQDILKFLWNIPAWIILLPRYTTNRVELSDDKIDTHDEVTAQIENDMLLKENPSLMLLELLWEKGIVMIKQLWEMFISWKNGDIALVLVTIAWLIAWWAWVVKLGAKLWKMNKVANVAEKIQKKAAKVDDIVWWAGIWHMTWEFSSKGPSKDVLIKNGNLDDISRINEAEKVLWRELNKGEKQALINAHNYWKDNIWNYTTWEKVVKWKKLLSAGFSRNEAKILMDQGIAWFAERMIKPEFKEGSIINIKRSNGRIHEAKVVWFDKDGRIITEWNEWNEQFTKSFLPKQLEEVNFINKFINNDIWNASSIEEVLNLIKKEWWIKWSQSFYNFNELEWLIYWYINWKNWAEFITNTNWLRNKIIQLKWEWKILRISNEELSRNFDHYSIWDLHWDYKAFIDNIETQWLAKLDISWKLVWTGWDKKLVFLWDILADRWVNGVDILEWINDLNKQANLEWWWITVMAWNHDDWAIAYLTGTEVSWWWGWMGSAVYWEQWRWIIEFDNSFWSKSNFQSLGEFIDWNNFTSKQVLENMRNSDKWRQILEQICSYKLIERIWDTLYTHTDMTQEMIDLIISNKWNINKINKMYQDNLVNMLFNWAKPDSMYKKFVDVFLNTSNREYWESFKWLKEIWIDRVIHWHSDKWLSGVKIIDWVKIRSVDSSYWKKWSNYDRPKAVWRVIDNRWEPNSQYFYN
jgi:hypothetical protein